MKPIFIECNNEHIKWCLLYEGYAVCSKDNIYGFMDGTRKVRENILDKYKAKFDFRVTTEPEDHDEFRTLLQYSPVSIIGMGAQSIYFKYFPEEKK